MRSRDVIDEATWAAIERSETQKRADQITEREVRTLIRGVLANPFTPPDAIVAAVAAGADEDVISQIGKTSIDGMVASGVAYPPPTARLTTPPQVPEEEDTDDDSGFLYSVLKGAVRGLDTVAKTGSQVYNGVVREFDRAFNDDNDFDIADAFNTINPYFYVKNLAEGVVNAVPMTEAYEFGRQLLEDGSVDQGSGFGSGGTVRANQAAEQRNRLGTVMGPNGQPQAWSVGRANADNLSRLEVIDRESIWFSVVSGTIDGVVSGATDVTNFIPARAGLNANGLRQIGGMTLRSATRHQEALTAAIRAGDDVAADRALTALGRTLGIDKRLLRNQNLDSTQVAIRAALLNEAGVLADNGMRRVLPMEFARFLGTGNGRRLVNRMIDATSPEEIALLHRGKIGTGTIMELAAAQNADEVITAYARALSNQGDGAMRRIGYFPRLQAFNVGNGSTVVRESLSERTRLFNLKESDFVIDIADPLSYQKIDRVYRILPVGMRDATTGGGIIKNAVGETTRAVTRGYNSELRKLRVNEWIRAHAMQDEAAMKDVVSKIANDMYMMFLNAGFVPDRAADFTRWSIDNTLAGKYSASDALAGVKISDPDTPLMVSQLLDNAVSIIDAETFQMAYREMSRFRQVLRTNPVFSKYARLNDRVANLVDQRTALEVAGQSDEILKVNRQIDRLTRTMDTMVDKSKADDPFRLASLARGTQMILDNGMGAIKNLLILRIAYIPRVVGEEIARVLSGGAFEGDIGDYMAAVLMRRYGTDANGIKFTKPVKAYDEAINAQADILADVDDMIALGTYTPAQIAAKRAEAAAMEPEIARLREAMGEATDTYYSALVGNRYTALDSITRQGMRNNVRKKSTAVANKTDDDLRNWIDGMAARMSFLAADPVVSQMAKFNMDLDKTALWLMNGKGRPWLEKITRARIADGKQFNPGNAADVKAWVLDMAEEVRYVTGGDQDLIEAVASGALAGQRLKYTDATTGRYVASRAIKKRLEKFAQQPNAPEQMWFTSRDYHFRGDRPQVLREVAALFFGGAYGVSSDVLARSPTFRRVYWRNLEDLMESASPKTAQQLVARARKAGVSRGQLDRLTTRARVANGDAGLDELDKLAKAGALTYSRDLLFDASKRGTGTDMVRLLIPFGDAFKEVMSTWAKLMARQRGLPVRRVSKKVLALQEATVGSPGDIYGYDEETGQYTAMRDGRQEGTFYVDPATGEFRYRVPMSNLLTGLIGNLTGNDTDGLGATAMGAEVRGLSMVGSILPGFGPIAQEAIDQVVPEGAAWRNFRSLIFPYGEPMESDTPGAQANALQRLVVPSWLRKTSALLPEDGFPGFLRNILNDARSDPMYQKTRNYAVQQIMAERMARGDLGAANAANYAEIVEQATALADAIYGMRGVFQNIGPATPAVEYMQETEIGNVQIGLLIDEMRDLERQYRNAGEDPDEAIFDMIDKYGPGVWLLTAPNTVPVVDGVNASVEWDNWYLEGGEEIVNTFPDVGAYFGPEGDFDLSTAGTQQARGLTKVATPEEKYEMAAENLAWLQYNRAVARLGPEDSWTLAQRRELSALREELQQRFQVNMASQESKKRRDDKINQLQLIYDQALEGDEVATRLMSSSTGKALAEYLDARDQLGQVAFEAYQLTGVESWVNATRAAPLRAELRRIGAELAAQDSGFARIYEAVLVREMTPLEQDLQAAIAPSEVAVSEVEPPQQRIGGRGRRRPVDSTQEIGGS